MKFFSKALRYLLFAFIGVLLLFCILFAVLQTKWAKDQILGKMVSYFQEKGIEVSISDLSGQPPFTWTIEEASFQISPESALRLSGIKLRFAILPFLQGRLVIDYMKVEDGEYAFVSESFNPSAPSIGSLKTLVRDKVAGGQLPFPIAVHYFHLDHFEIRDRATQKTFSLALSGNAHVSEDKENFALDLHFLSSDHARTYLEIALAGSAKRNALDAKAKWNMDVPAFLAPTLSGKTAGEVFLKGPWASWSALLNDRPLTSPLIGEAKTILDETHFPSYPLFDGKWKGIAFFSLPSSEEIDIRQLSLSSDWSTVQGKARLRTHFDLSQAALDISLSDLARLTSTLKGTLKAKAYYDQGDYKASFAASDAYIDAFALRTAKGFLKGTYANNTWETTASITSDDADVPFQNTFALEYTPHSKISLSDFALKIPDGDISGYVSYDMERRVWDGSFFAGAQHLDRFAYLFKDSGLNGSIAAECRLSSQGTEQNAKCILFGKNLRYKELLIDDASLSAEVLDALDDPRGRVSLIAEKVYTPAFYLSRLNFNTSSSEENWPFFLDIEGRIENTFQCYAKGFWRKENPLFTLELTQFYGDLSSTPFALKFPSTLEWSADYLNLSPFDFNIGEGHLYTHFEFSPIRSLGKWELAHFPLEVLSVFRPSFNLKGCISTQGYIDSYDDNLEGACNAVLEDANVLHYGKKEPFRAKGSLQARLNNDTLQLYTDLQAIDNQFFNLNATLPTTHQLYPFRIALDETQPVSAELLAEGKLQDLFDFINLGTNSFTGLVSSRLFLSKTLADPSLHGQIEWQNGTFENYFTGLVMKNIDAQFEAQGDVLYLTSLTATDEKKGEVFADGKILLKPNEKFPYTFSAELSNLHALGFDMIDSNFTGPVYFKGDLRNMYAEGNLIIDEALIQLNEKLPYEVPSLPTTYINTPPHLTSRVLPKGPGFAFHIDVELTAENKVKVEGRGLNAELQGHVRLSGTNFNILPNGSLKLVKGEYQFAGKVFKLTEGEIVFNDKPSFSSYVNLSGVLSLPDMTITAMLMGPLASPQLTFQSNPQKSTSSILARILFNKDIADISQPEAIQLATTLMSMSGGAGPDVLEAIRKSIGIDRLSIAAARPGSDEVAVQIGKYLTRGILITLSQSATSSQVIVEVELPKGFVFVAETQEEEEGKFSLKWTKSY